MNDLDSPIEEAENDSDFTIKDDESATELDELESNDYSNEEDLSEDDTDLSDFARSTRRRSTRSGGRRKNKKRRRYDSDEESEYGYKTRRKSKRVTYKEMSTTEEEEDDYDDWSDNSEKYKKNKKDKKKKKKISDSELSDELTGSDDERAVVKKKKNNKKSKKDYSSEEELTSEEEGKRKSRRTQNKKVYDDFTDIESEIEEPQKEETTTELKTYEKSKEPTETIPVDQQQEQKQEQIQTEEMAVIEQKQFFDPDLQNKDEVPITKRTPKIKITKPNPKLAKNKNLVVEQMQIDLPSTAVSVDQINLPKFDLNNPDMPLNVAEQINQTLNSNNSQELSMDSSMEKKKRGRKPKDLSNEIKDPNAPPNKRGRKPKSTPTLNDHNQQPDPQQNLVNLNLPNAPAINASANSALSQLTQFALDTSNKLLPNSNPLANPANMQQQLDMARQLLAAELATKNLPILNNNLQTETKGKIKFRLRIGP